MGFLHHANYFNYFEMGRVELFRSLGGDYRKMEQGGLFFVVTSLECKYRAPARYDDLLTLKTTLADTGAVKLEHHYELYCGKRLLATARSILACVDRSGRPRPIPESVTA